jgi:mRNA interferase RelE/StbE
LEIGYYRKVITKDIPALDTVTRVRIRRAIDQKLKNNPSLYGEPLRHTLKKLWKLRVGDWRVIYAIEGNIVEIVAIAHRRDIYTIILNRIYHGRT